MRSRTATSLATAGTSSSEVQTATAKRPPGTDTRNIDEHPDDAGDDELEILVVLECPVCDRTCGDLASDGTSHELIEDVGGQVAQVRSAYRKLDVWVHDAAYIQASQSWTSVSPGRRLAGGEDDRMLFLRMKEQP
jgi:hypothetical protein